MADLTGLVPNFGKPPTPTIQERLATLQAQAEYAHKTWYPAIGETIACEVIAFNYSRLIVKTIDIAFLNVIVNGDKSFEDKNGNDLFVKGDLIALTFNGDKPPRGFNQYSVTTEKPAR